MNNQDILRILEEYNLTIEQIQTLESFEYNQITSLLNLIFNKKIKYLDAATVIIRNKMNISEKQLAVLNKAPNASVACVLAKFFADKKCALSNDNKIALAEYIVSIKDKDSAIGALNIIWQLAGAGITRTNEEKYVDLGKTMANFSKADDLVYVKDFLYTIYPKAYYRQLIGEDILENKNIEKDIIELMSNCPSERMAYVHNLLAGLMTSTKITSNNYDRFINTINKAINIRDNKILELAGETSHLFCVIKDNRQLDYVNAILDSNSTVGAEFSAQILKKSTSYLNDTVYETPELLKLVNVIGTFESNDVHNWFGNKMHQEINANNIPAALYLTKNQSGACVSLINHVLDILEDEENYVLFDKLYEEDEDAAIRGLRMLSESFPNIEFSVNKTYVKKVNKVTEE